MSGPLNLDLSRAAPVTQESEPVAPRPVRPLPVVTLSLIGLNVLIFLQMVVTGVGFLHPTSQQVLAWGADFGPLTMWEQPWRLVTSCFLHFGVIHILFNMYILFQIGVFTELLFGRLRFFLVYMVAGIGGNVAGLYFHPFVVGAGASGAIFGLYGGMLAFLLIRPGVIPRNVAVSLAKSAAVFIGYNLIYGLASPTTDLVAHGGGLAVGFFAGCLLAPAHARATSQMRWLRPALSGVFVLAIVVTIIFPPRISAAQKDWYRALLTDPSVPIGRKGKLIYNGIATKDQAQVVAATLVNEFGMSDAASVVLLHQDAAGASLSLMLRGDEKQTKTYDNFTSTLVDGKTVVTHKMEARAPLPWNDANFLASLQIVGPLVDADLGGAPLTIRLLNRDAELRREVPIDRSVGILTVGTKDKIRYSGQATVKDAQGLGTAMQEAGFFVDKGVQVGLTKLDGVFELSFFVADKAWDKPGLTRTFSGIATKIAPAIGGLPLKVHLVDEERNQTKDLLVR